MTANGGEDPLFLQQIISRYETEEDDFLREIESMQQCSNTDTSEEFTDESPVLGTLCSLVSEITDLRKQNRKLRRKLIESTSLSPPTRSPVRAGVVHLVNATFRDSRDRILPRFKTSTPTSTASRSSKSRMTVKSGARERMSSPPHKDNLTMSSYSTDLSSDTFSSSCAHQHSHNYHHRVRKPPPLVLPELSDSDAEQVSLLAEDEQQSNDENCLSPCPRMPNYSHSDRTSASSNSASSCVDVPSAMTASRTSFLDFFGFRRKRDKLASSPSPAPASPTKVTIKKRKRKISDSDSVGSSLHHSTRQIEQQTETHSSSLMQLGGAPLNIKGASAGGSAVDLGRTDIPGSAGQPPVSSKQVSKSLKNVSADRMAKRRSHFFDESEDDFEGYHKKGRPKSCIFLTPGKVIAPKAGRLKCKTKSCKSVSSRDTSVSEEANRATFAMEEDLQCMKEENSMLRNEIQILKTRNNRLIDQFREKSMQLSRVQGHISEVEDQLSAFRQKSRLNDALDKLCLKDRLSMSSQAVMETLEEKLREFDKKLQCVRSDAAENQRLALETAMREQSHYQSQLEQIEQLQRENFSLLQLKAGDPATQDKAIRQRLDLMPSYDAMYSFAMGIVRKLSQLRSALSEKTSMITQREFEIMHAQFTLLIAQAQTERLKQQLHALRKTKRPQRSASFHGEDLLESLAKPSLNFYLPFRESGARIERLKRSQNDKIDSLVETNEQNIETEFLRLFDYARTLSKICEDSVPLCEKSPKEPVYQNTQEKPLISPTHSPLAGSRRRLQKNPPQMKNVRLSNLRDKDLGHVPARRPTSLVETKDQRYCNNIRKFGEDMCRFHPENAAEAAPHRMPPSGHVKSIVSSLQDVSNVSGFRSPTTTPVLARRVSGIRSPANQQGRRLVKQSSLQNPPTIYRDSEKESHPIYDSPPRQTDSSDYVSIPKQMSSSAGSANTIQLNLSGKLSAVPHRRASIERRLPLQKRGPVNGNGPLGTRLTQPTPSPSFSPIIGAMNGNKSNAGSILCRKSPTDSPYLARSSLRQNIGPGSSAASRSSTTSPLTPRRFLHYQQQPPSILSNLQQALHQYSPHHEQTIKEEDEPRSISVSEASVTTTIERSSAPVTSSAQSTTAPTTSMTTSGSRLPKLSPQLERAKKAGSSWLSKLRINPRKPSCT